MTTSKLLHQQIEESLKSILSVQTEIPAYIKENLKHTLRPYQERALEHFIFTRQHPNDSSLRHLLFRMATGSGKTDILASIILYLYKENGMKNFIFFVDSEAIIKKTELNLTNQYASKYLYNADGITIDHEKIEIKQVDTFPSHQEPNTIYLKFTTIQKLHKELEEPRENSMTFEGMEDLPIVLLADEAHHINASTKSTKKALETQQTWESTVIKLFNLNEQNMLFEFTATMDLGNKNLLAKYGNKVVFDYDLKRFMEDGYSKEVKLLRSNNTDEQKMLNAILLSQYRKYTAQKYDQYLKPIILFQSTRIETSNNAYFTFLDIVEKLNVKQLEELVSKGSEQYQLNTTLGKMFSFYKEKENYKQVVRDIKTEFVEETVLNVNDKNFLNNDNTFILNTLEEINNPIRVIFAVAKLNEGWDVLNLFDIVRINEGASSGKGATDSEAQLIGRGARYYPIPFSDLDVKKTDIAYGKRKFDHTADERKILETMHFHTINENAYIKQLEKSLSAAQIIVSSDESEVLEAKLKKEFKKTTLYEHGKIYVNKVISPKDTDYTCLQDYGVPTIYNVELNRTLEQTLGGSVEQIESKIVSFYFEKYIVQKAIRLNSFFTFRNIKKYIPNIQSMNEFIDSDKYLQSIQIQLRLPLNWTTDDLTSSEKLKLTVDILDDIARKIENSYKKNKGTKEFIGLPIKDVIRDYSVEISNILTSTYTNLVVKPNGKPMKLHNWYVYDKAIVNGLEENLINFIAGYMETLKEKYDDVYLIRNERFKEFKIVEFDGVRGFMPDFILLLTKGNCYYQVLIEPKGKHLMELDYWKQQLLQSINNDESIMIDDDHVRLIGLRFFSNDPNSYKEFVTDFKQFILE